MGISFTSIKNESVALVLKDWEKQWGDNDSTLDLNDFRLASQKIPKMEETSYATRLWSVVPEMSGCSSPDFKGEVVEILAHVQGLSQEEIIEQLKIVPNGSSSSGDSVDVATQNDALPAARDIRDSPFQWQLRFLGVPMEDIGWRAWHRARMSDSSAYFEGRVGLANFVFSVPFNRPEHVHSAAPHQIFAVPGMTSVDMNRTQSEMKSAGSSASKYFSGILGDQSQFGLCYFNLLKANEEGRTDLVYFDHTGNNDTTTYGNYLISPTTTPEEFAQSLEERFQILLGERPINAATPAKAVDGLTIVRVSLLPFDKILVPVQPGARMIVSHQPYRVAEIPEGSRALSSIARMVAAGDLVDGCDVLTPEEFEALKCNQAQLKAEEKRVCEKYGVTLIESSKYLEEGLKYFSVDDLVSADGIHPNSFTYALIGFSRALEMRDLLHVAPSEETVQEFSEKIGVDPSVVHLALEIPDSLEAYRMILSKANLPPPAMTDAQKLKAARFFAQWFYPTLRGEQVHFR